MIDNGIVRSSEGRLQGKKTKCSQRCNSNGIKTKTKSPSLPFRFVEAASITTFILPKYVFHQTENGYFFQADSSHLQPMQAVHSEQHYEHNMVHDSVTSFQLNA